MSIQMILLPLFVEVALTFGLLIWMAVLRGGDFKSGAVRVASVALREPNWPTRTLQAMYSYSNQFELPVLFYVLTILVIITRHADVVFVALAWVFVLTRLAHAYVYVTSNVMRQRGLWFGIGAIALLVAWVWFALRILLGLP